VRVWKKQKRKKKQKMEIKNNPLKVFIVVGVILIIFLMIFTIREFSQIKKEGIACMSSPFVWGAQKVAEKEDGISCSCVTHSGKTFNFDEKKMGQVQDYQYYGGGK